MQGGSVDLTTRQYSELLQVPMPQVPPLMVYQQPLAATPPSLLSHDQFQMSNQQLIQQVPCSVSYPQQPQQLTGQSPFEAVRQQVQAEFSQDWSIYQHVQRQSPTSSQHEGCNDATPAASAHSNVHAGWDGSPSHNVSDLIIDDEIMWSPQQDLVGSAVAISTPMLTSGTNSLHQLLREGDMLPPGPRLPPAALAGLPPAAPQRVDSFKFGQQAFGQPLPEPASCSGHFDVHAEFLQNFMDPSTTSVGHQFDDGPRQTAFQDLGPIHLLGGQSGPLTEDAPAMPSQPCWKLMFGHNCR